MKFLHQRGILGSSKKVLRAAGGAVGLTAVLASSTGCGTGCSLEELISGAPICGPQQPLETPDRPEKPEWDQNIYRRMGSAAVSNPAWDNRVIPLEIHTLLPADPVQQQALLKAIYNRDIDSPLHKAFVKALTDRMLAANGATDNGGLVKLGIQPDSIRGLVRVTGTNTDGSPILEFEYRNPVALRVYETQQPDQVIEGLRDCIVSVPPLSTSANYADFRMGTDVNAAGTGLTSGQMRAVYSKGGASECYVNPAGSDLADLRRNIVSDLKIVGTWTGDKSFVNTEWDRAMATILNPDAATTGTGSAVWMGFHDAFQKDYARWKAEKDNAYRPPRDATGQIVDKPDIVGPAPTLERFFISLDQMDLSVGYNGNKAVQDLVTSRLLTARVNPFNMGNRLVMGERLVAEYKDAVKAGRNPPLSSLAAEALERGTQAFRRLNPTATPEAFFIAGSPVVTVATHGVYGQGM